MEVEREPTIERLAELFHKMNLPDRYLLLGYMLAKEEGAKATTPTEPPKKTA